jgi:hypothetical protein
MQRMRPASTPHLGRLAVANHSTGDSIDEVRLDFAEYPIMKTIFSALTGLVLAMSAAQAQTATPTSTSVDPRWGCEAVKEFPAPDLGEPQNIDNFKKQLIYYRCTAL